MSVDDSLDGRLARERFLGKDLDAAQKLFEENPFWNESLGHMGPVAFRYYVQAAIRSLRSESTECRHSFALGLLCVLEVSAEFNPEELTPIAEDLASLCGYVIDHYDRFTLPQDVAEIFLRNLANMDFMEFANGHEWIDLRRRYAVMRRILREIEERRP